MWFMVDANGVIHRPNNINTPCLPHDAGDAIRDTPREMSYRECRMCCHSDVLKAWYSMRPWHTDWSIKNIRNLRRPSCHNGHGGDMSAFSHIVESIKTLKTLKSYV